MFFYFRLARSGSLVTVALSILVQIMMTQGIVGIHVTFLLDALLSQASQLSNELLTQYYTIRIGIIDMLHFQLII